MTELEHKNPMIFITCPLFNWGGGLNCFTILSSVHGMLKQYKMHDCIEIKTIHAQDYSIKTYPKISI